VVALSTEDDVAFDGQGAGIVAPPTLLAQVVRVVRVSQMDFRVRNPGPTALNPNHREGPHAVHRTGKRYSLAERPGWSIHLA
jgi:hypothetical protein